MRRILVIAICIVVTIAVVTGIVLLIKSGEPKLKSGVVLQKQYNPAHYETYTTMMRIGKTMIPQVRTRHVPDRYYLLIQGEQSNGETIIEWWSVTCNTFNAVNIGQLVER